MRVERSSVLTGCRVEETISDKGMLGACNGIS